jgi:ABC-type molybdate transport system permease subunit
MGHLRSCGLPLARPGFVTASILGFAHTVGEFGVVLMIGGNIPDKTRVVSVQIFDHVEAMEYPRPTGWPVPCWCSLPGAAPAVRRTPRQSWLELK